jgi:hypothetical protein
MPDYVRICMLVVRRFKYSLDSVVQVVLQRPDNFVGSGAAEIDLLLS